MSSWGAVHLGQILWPGRRIELALAGLLLNKCALRLQRGRIVRFENGVAAMEIQQYEFRRSRLRVGFASASQDGSRLVFVRIVVFSPICAPGNYPPALSFALRAGLLIWM